MRTITNRHRVGATLIAGVLALSACSSSGGGGGSVSTADVEKKLRSDPQVSKLKTQLNGNAKAFDTLVSCAAKAIKKDVDGDKVKSYVDGDTDIDKLGSEKDGQQVGTDVQSCAKSALGTG